MLSPSSAVQSAIVYRASLVLLDLGLPFELVGYGRTEIVANVLMVVPAGLLGVLVQGFFLRGRSPSGVDVVANTLGMLVGAMLGSVVRRWGTRHG